MDICKPKKGARLQRRRGIRTEFVLPLAAETAFPLDSAPICRAVSMLRRDMTAVLAGCAQENDIVLRREAFLAPEEASIMLLLNLENHPDNDELFALMQAGMA